MAQIIEYFTDYDKGIDKIYIDLFDRTKKKLIDRMKKVFWKPLPYDKIIATHHADEKYKIVSLASMICKHLEDTETEQLKKLVNFDFGGKSSNDRKVIAFVKKFPDSPLIRRSWGKIIPDILKKS